MKLTTFAFLAALGAGTGVVASSHSEVASVSEMTTTILCTSTSTVTYTIPGTSAPGEDLTSTSVVTDTFVSTVSNPPAAPTGMQPVESYSMSVSVSNSSIEAPSTVISTAPVGGVSSTGISPDITPIATGAANKPAGVTFGAAALGALAAGILL